MINMPAMPPNEVPDELMNLGRDALGEAIGSRGGAASRIVLKMILAAVLPTHRAMVLREASEDPAAVITISKEEYATLVAARPEIDREVVKDFERLRGELHRLRNLLNIRALASASHARNADDSCMDECLGCAVEHAVTGSGL